MLNPYRRHGRGSDGEPCKHTAKGRSWKRCTCPIWVDGSLENREYRFSLDTRDWQKACEKVNGWNEAGRMEAIVSGKDVTEALNEYAIHRTSIKLEPGSNADFQITADQLQDYCKNTGIVKLNQFTRELADGLRNTWASKHKNKPTTINKKLVQVVGFFHFAMDREWVQSNVFKLTHQVKVTKVPTLPFTREELQALLNACEDLASERKGQERKNIYIRLRALLLLLRYSGLRIGDAITLDMNRLQGPRLFLRTAKTGQEVFVVLPPFVVEELMKCPRISPNHWFWNGATKITVAANTMRVPFLLACEEAKVRHGHFHRFRDTFAVELLLANVPLDRVSALLGHSSITTTQMYYSPWVRARQDQLEDDLRQAWKNDPLARNEGQRAREAVGGLRRVK